MSYTWFWTLSCSIFLAAIIGRVRFRKIAPVFYPFIFFIWLGAFNEILSIVILRVGGNDRFNNNMYVLLESALLIFQLARWNGLGRLYRITPYLIAAVGLVWLLENILVCKFSSITSCFRLVYSTVIVLMAIHAITTLILSEKGPLYRNAVFLICIGFIVYFTFKILVEIFWFYGLSHSADFRVNIYSIMIWINFATNLTYALAILWIPRKQRFSMLY